ncbi:MAG: DUF4783 domain-containing protein [Bacteroidales bacterium]|nr:DUF4783 domain-containing protein [Bacteroidales bacterium]
MRISMKLFLATAALLLCLSANAAKDSYDVFVPISKYLGSGDAESLSAWFSDNLEISIMSSTNDSSRNQAKQILKSFFESHTPRSFEINHTASRSNSKYALGYLNAGGELFEVTIFVSKSKDRYTIQQLKIDRIR